jgi:hypothetical protein
LIPIRDRSLFLSALVSNKRLCRILIRDYNFIPTPRNRWHGGHGMSASHHLPLCKVLPLLFAQPLLSPMHPPLVEIPLPFGHVCHMCILSIKKAGIHLAVLVVCITTVSINDDVVRVAIVLTPTLQLIASLFLGGHLLTVRV